MTSPWSQRRGRLDLVGEIRGYATAGLLIGSGPGRDAYSPAGRVTPYRPQLTISSIALRPDSCGAAWA